MNGPARRNPACEFRPVGMSRIVVDAADSSGDLDLFALYAHGLCAFLKKTPQRALRLKADQQNRGCFISEPMFEMMPDAAGVAHAAARNDHVKAGQFRDGFAFIDRLGEAQMRRVQKPVDIGAQRKA